MIKRTVSTAASAARFFASGTKALLPVPGKEIPAYQCDEMSDMLDAMIADPSLRKGGYAYENPHPTDQVEMDGNPSSEGSSPSMKPR